MEITMRHRTGRTIKETYVTKYTQDKDYITLFYDEIFCRTKRCKMLSTTEYEIVRIDA